MGMINSRFKMLVLVLGFNTESQYIITSEALMKSYYEKSQLIYNYKRSS